MTTYETIVSACWAVFVVYWLISSFFTKRTLNRSFGSWFVIRLVFIIAIVLLARATALNPALFQPLPLHPVIALAGVVLCVIGIAFAVWARVYLGANWGMPRSVKENPELVVSGPYAYVRHPIYSGVLLALLGSAAVMGLWFLVPFVLFGAYFIYSAAAEEKLMAKEFPDAYASYKARTHMLVPFVF